MVGAQMPTGYLTHDGLPHLDDANRSAGGKVSKMIFGGSPSLGRLGNILAVWSKGSTFSVRQRTDEMGWTADMQENEDWSVQPGHWFSVAKTATTKSRRAVPPD